MKQKGKTAWKWAGSLLLFLVLFEAMFHYFLGNMSNVWLYERNPADGRCFGLKPNVTVEYTGWWSRIEPVQMEVNAAGYRGDVLPEEKSGFRIIMLGDSFIYGQAATTDQTIPAGLEAETGIEVLNFGVPGFSIEDQVEHYQLFASRWQADLVLLYINGNDLELSLCESAKRPPPGWLMATVRTVRLGTILSTILLGPPSPKEPAMVARNSMQALAHEVSAHGATLAGILAQAPELHNQPIARDTREQFSTPQKIQPPKPGQPPEAHPYDPARDPPRYSTPEQSILKALALPGVLWMDATYWMNGGPDRALPRIPGEGHFTPEGNREAARQIASWLKEKQLLPTSQNLSELPSAP
jgi:hypothetical protein